MSEQDKPDANEEKIEDLDVPEEAAEDVGGGRAPQPPSGPVPIPYPNEP